MAKKAVRVSEKEITFEDGYVTRTPFNIGLGAVSNMVEEHGNIVKQVALPQDPDKLHAAAISLLLDFVGGQNGFDYSGYGRANLLSPLDEPFSIPLQIFLMTFRHGRYEG